MRAQCGRRRQRQDAVAEFVSCMLKPGIRRILAKADFLLFTEGVDLRAGNTQERAVNGEFPELRNRSHTPESSGARASEEIEKTGLDLIIGMMGQDEGFCFCPGRAFLEEGHAQFAGGQLK